MIKYNYVAAYNRRNTEINYINSISLLLIEKLKESATCIPLQQSSTYTKTILKLENRATVCYKL